MLPLPVWQLMVGGFILYSYYIRRSRNALNFRNLKSWGMQHQPGNDIQMANKIKYAFLLILATALFFVSGYLAGAGSNLALSFFLPGIMFPIPFLACDYLLFRQRNSLNILLFSPLAYGVAIITFCLMGELSISFPLINEYRLMEIVAGLVGGTILLLYSLRKDFFFGKIPAILIISALSGFAFYYFCFYKGEDINDYTGNPNGHLAIALGVWFSMIGLTIFSLRLLSVRTRSKSEFEKPLIK
ncbi:MAG: hypothetical protein M3R17_19070 [Bacteroidota bacterium]|nr:hypothetical protein [Bacteroidota bacterium]